MNKLAFGQYFWQNRTNFCLFAALDINGRLIRSYDFICHHLLYLDETTVFMIQGSKIHYHIF